MVGQAGVLQAIDDQVHTQRKNHYLPWGLFEHLACVDGVTTSRDDIENERTDRCNGADWHPQWLNDKEADQE